ncbi:DEAD/DEAH box helicase family protein [Sorangium sp. So ce429]
MITSVNFEFLRAKRPGLIEFVAFAEQYAWPDPSSALVKLRVFVEEMVKTIFAELSLVAPRQAHLNDLLNESAFEAATPRVILTKLHAVRQRGNKAAHGSPVTTPDALAMLQEAYDLAAWFHVRFDGGTKEECGTYTPPSGSSARETKEALKKAHKETLDKLAEKEAQLEKILANLEAQRAKAAATTAAPPTQAELDEARLEGQKFANLLGFSEAETRKKLIDDDLRRAGWDVGPSGASTEQVGQEVEVDGQPTKTGKGAVDYVLWGDDGRPLGLVEAKKTAKDPELGKKQAALYADALEKRYGYRPVIFYTNGIETFLWDDVLGEPPRKVYGFYAKPSLEYLRFQRENRVPLDTLAADPKIAGRMYQIEAIKRVCERFADNHRKALIVQATGTGKTRVAIALCELLLRANWAKRILFLCDRRELRKQADSVFKEFLPGEPRAYVTEESAEERKHRIYLGTYPAMMKRFESFDPGFFDLIIADESHRSIYNRYRDLFRYFDAREVGLTATPLKKISKNTYALFGCEDQDPTAHFSLDDALKHNPPYLVPPRVFAHSTQFRREGIKFDKLKKEQQLQLLEDEVDPEAVYFDPEDVDKQIFNKDTTRHILRNLMENGIRVGGGSRIGKTIIFARSKEHARHIAGIFAELYPQYGGSFLEVVVHDDPRAEQLITDFKGPKKEPTIAVSVDMLDTGIDVPEIVNLVFAKPVESSVKFWQMVGRGTRLCENLFGPGEDKKEFLIFDHWDNTKHFFKDYGGQDDRPPRSPQEQRFAARVELAAAALDAFDRPAFERAIDLILADIAALAGLRTISVRDNWREINAVADKRVLLAFDRATKGVLLTVIAPLMQWTDIRGAEDAYRFDLLVAHLQAARLAASPAAGDLQAELVQRVEQLPTNLSQVQAKGETIKRVRSRAFWQGASCADLEVIREELRGLMSLVERAPVVRLRPRVIDVTDGDIEFTEVNPRLDGLELVAYRNRVESVLKEHFQEHPTLVKIRAGVPVNAYDLEDLTKLVLELDPKIDLRDLLLYYPETANHLEYAIRRIVGMDAIAADAAFSAFVHAHPELNAQQIHFLGMLKQYIAMYGFIVIDRLYDKPFTNVHADSIEGVFPDGTHVDEILDILSRFSPPRPATQPSQPPPSAS